MVDVSSETVFDPAQIERVQALFPDWTAFLFAFGSFLGSVYFVVPVVVLAYWLVDRHRFAPWLGIVATGYALMGATKGLFAVSRPGVGPPIEPDAFPTLLAVVYAPLVEVETASFPSGHAMAGTIVWAMLALETDVADRRTRFAVASVVIAFVALSRVAVGIHYPADVLAGVALGLAVVVACRPVAWRLADGSRDAVTLGLFSALIPLAAAATIIDPRGESIALLGGAAGMAVAWWKAPPDRRLGRVTGRTVALAGAVAALLAVVTSIVVAMEEPVGWFVLGAMVGTALVWAPHLEAEERYSPRRR